MAEPTDPHRRTRIAPTPSGFLHVGNAVNFLLTSWRAADVGASILLRIDDYDVVRMRPEYLADIFGVLEWLDLPISSGPSGPDEFHRSWSSRHRVEGYLEGLTRVGGLSYACDCSRRQIGSTPYRGACRDAGKPLIAGQSALRVRCPPDAPLGDVVVWRRDGLPSYQWASVLDDIAYGITDIVRGSDLADSTATQRILASALEAAEHPGASVFLAADVLHHGLITGGDGEKLSKSTASAGAPMQRAPATRSRIIDTASVMAEALGITPR